MTWLLRPLLWLVEKLGFVAFIGWATTQRLRRRDAERIVEVKDAQLKEAMDRPVDRDDLIKRLREDGL